VQVQVHHVEPHIAGAHFAHDGVGVRAVEIQESSGLVDLLCDGPDVLLEETQGIRIGKHDARQVFTQMFVQLLKGHHAFPVRRQLDHFEAGKMS
jgi:hypothetical protein